MDTTISETSLKKDSISKTSVTIMAISAAAPAMCLGGSLGFITLGSGPAAALAFAIATIVVLLIGVSYSNLSERYNSCGGTYSYIKNVFGDRAGFWTAFIYIGVMITTGVQGAIFTTYLNYLVPSIPLWVGIIIYLVPIVIVVWFGVELTAKALIVLWVIQMYSLIYPAIKIISMTSADLNTSVLENSLQAFNPSFGISGLMLGVLICIWCFVGFECPAYMGEEIKGGAKSVKFALLFSAIAIGSIYVLVCWLWVAALTPEQFSAINGSATFLADYAKLVGYAAGDKYIALATMISCAGCTFGFASLMPRFLFDLGRTGYLPKAFGKLNKHQTPLVGLLVYACLWLATAFYGTYIDVNALFTHMSVFASAVYAFISLANMKDRWNEIGTKSFIMNKIIPVITIMILLYMIFSTSRGYLLFAGAWALAGIIIAFIWKACNKNSSM